MSSEPCVSAVRLEVAVPAPAYPLLSSPSMPASWSLGEANPSPPFSARLACLRAARSRLGAWSSLPRLPSLPRTAQPETRTLACPGAPRLGILEAKMGNLINQGASRCHWGPEGSGHRSKAPRLRCQGDSVASDCPGGHVAPGSAARFLGADCKGVLILSDLVPMGFGIVAALFV